MVLSNPWRPFEVSCIPPGALLCRGFNDILFKIQKRGQVCDPCSRGQPESRPCPQGGPSIIEIKNAKQPRNCCPRTVALKIAKPRASLGHMRDTSGPRFCFPARMRKIPAHASQERKHCEFICGGTELQCLFNFLPVWDRQGGNIGKHSNLARKGRPHRVTKPKTSPGKILEQKTAPSSNVVPHSRN